MLRVQAATNHHYLYPLQVDDIHQLHGKVELKGICFWIGQRGGNM
jgi:hypothetical protein